MTPDEKRKLIRAHWKLQQSTCPVCGITIRRTNMSRHLQSQTHIDNLKSKYVLMDSDHAFSRFLDRVRGNYMVGAERRIYQLARAEYVESLTKAQPDWERSWTA